MKIKENLRYTSAHLWVAEAENGLLMAGITDYAQDMLGDIVYVESPKVGSHITESQPCGLVESVKTGSDLLAPLNGTVEAVNEALQGNPEQINDTPYEAWIFKFHAASADDLGKLLTASAYKEFLQE